MTVKVNHCLISCYKFEINYVYFEVVIFFHSSAHVDSVHMNIWRKGFGLQFSALHVHVAINNTQSRTQIIYRKV